MLFLSAQPDTTYFRWQLEIQLRNLQSLGVNKEKIHVLIAYDKDLGPRPCYRSFVMENKHLALFFTYPDQRNKPKYASSIRPHILQQHFAKFPKLKSESIFYHDSDVLFSRIPRITDSLEDETCYVSDTSNYLDVQYIRSVSSEDLLDKMLDIVGLDKSTLEKESDHTGGAQYILKNISATFWKKVERDSEQLYLAMKNYNIDRWRKTYNVEKIFRSKANTIQAWCADMWAVLWNLWLLDRTVKIHSEMEFSWPFNPIEDWKRLAIQHYSGNIDDKDRYFKKGEYLNYSPWYDTDLDRIPNISCSYEIVKHIKYRKKELDAGRTHFPNAIVLLEINNLSKETFLKYQLQRKFIQKHLNIDVTVLTNHNGSEEHDHIFLKPNEQDIKHLLYRYEAFVVCPLSQILDIPTIQKTLGQRNVNSILNSVNSLRIDGLFTEAFFMMLEVDLLKENIGKFNPILGEIPIYVLNKDMFKEYIDGRRASFIKNLKEVSLAESFIF